MALDTPITFDLQDNGAGVDVSSIVVRVNNVFNIPDNDGNDRWIAYPEPQVIIEFRDGFTGDLEFAYSVSTSEARAEKKPVPLERVKIMGGIKD